MEHDKTRLTAEIAQDERELREAEKSLESFRDWKRDLTALIKAIRSGDAVDLRVRLRAHLREFIAKVEVFASGYPALRDEDAEASRRKQRDPQMVDDFVQQIEARALEHFPEAMDDPFFIAFVQHVAELRLTKKGRFLRIHFRGGAMVDVVPEGSLASGVELVRDGKKRTGWRFVSPNLDRQWREFRLSFVQLQA